jgi:hypothetical protein
MKGRWKPIILMIRGIVFMPLLIFLGVHSYFLGRREGYLHKGKEQLGDIGNDILSIVCET